MPRFKISPKIFILLLSVTLINCQDQFHREVKNPSGPSQVILRGGSLNGNGVEEVEQRFVVEDQPQPLPLQAAPPEGEAPIPEGNPNNPFTQGENGFGLRLTQGQQTAQPSPPFVLQFVQQQAPVQIDQPAPIVHQTEITLPQLPAGQQYVDVYGRPIVLERDPTPPPSPSPPPTTPAPTAPPQPQQVFVDQYGRQIAQVHHVLQEAAVIHQPAPISVGGHVTQVVEQAPVPPAQVVHSAPVATAVQQVVETGALAVPVATKKVLHPPALTLQTYAVPAVRKIKGLTIPYAQKVQVVAPAPVDVVYPPTVQAEAFVKSRHRTRISPAPAVVHEEVHLTPGVQHHVIDQVHHQPVAVHEEVRHHVGSVQQEVHHHVQPVATEVHVETPVQHVQQVAQPQIHQLVSPGIPHVQQVLQPQVHLAPGVHQEVHHAAPVEIQHAVHPGQVYLQHPPQLLAHPQQFIYGAGHPHHLVPAPHQLLQVAQPAPVAVAPPQVIAHHPVAVHAAPVAPAVTAPVVKKVVDTAAPVVVEKAVVPTVTKVIEKTIVPEVTLIQQPVLSKVLFQRHIFNVKHGSEPIIYQDLCTVYPYQKNIRACVLKKAALPELHHPDVRTVNVEQQPFPDQTNIIAGSPVIAPAPSSAPTVTVTKGLPNNIQEAIKRESARSKANAEAASKTEEQSTPQPDTAESRDSTKQKRKSRRSKNSRRDRKSNSSSEKPFELA